jgi:L-ascorbate 6-phosphate lactonase
LTNRDCYFIIKVTCVIGYAKNKKERLVMSGKTTITFAGQAGFILESANGYKVGIDLYLSDCCYRFFGFKRLMPYVFDPNTLMLDLLVATHAHYDHFDPDSVPILLKNGKTELVCAKDVKEEAIKLGLDDGKINYLKIDDVYENENIKIKAMRCDHGELAPDAIGLLITIDGKRIYITGDTAYREDYFKNMELDGLDLLILPINGAFGNLNEEEAVKAVSVIKPRLTVPCHYWNFAEHGGNPLCFMDLMKQQSLPYLLMRAGETAEL